MPTNEIYKPGWQVGGIACTSPALPASGGPVRYGLLTGVALTAEAEGGNPALQCTVDFGPGVWDLPVTDTVGGGIVVGATLFLLDGAPATIANNPAGYFFGFALEVVGVGATTTIQVLHVPSPGAGTLGAGTIGTVNLAAGCISADAPGRALMAAGYFDEAHALLAFAADGVRNAWLLDAIQNGAFAADAPTRALFADGIWPEAKLVAQTLTGISAAVVANANTVGGVTLTYRLDIADAATGDVDVVLAAVPTKIRVIDAWAVKTGGAGGAANTVQVQTGAGAAITDAMVTNINDQAIVRAASIDDATHEIAAAGTLRVHRVKAGGNAACTVYVLAVAVS